MKLNYRAVILEELTKAGVNLPIEFSYSTQYACTRWHRERIKGRYIYIPSLIFNLDALQDCIYSEEALKFIIWHELGHYNDSLKYSHIEEYQAVEGLVREYDADLCGVEHTSTRAAIEALEAIVRHIKLSSLCYTRESLERVITGLEARILRLKKISLDKAV